MLVPNVVGVTLHMRNGKTIHFGDDEISVRLCNTTLSNEDGTVTVPVMFYMITTKLEERFIANAGTGEDWEFEGQEFGHLGDLGTTSPGGL